ncbi:MAG: imidazolonepropionase [Intrasporangium sp.]|uniref:imidazolonepropionase n=1 Tax=Intrasporangium sp. TaxID=1925024 RepID=UPI00264861D1|nr:imidazolonepropionase [Intrasporangium sp.]MDN5796593.1 imidazolonepropionase [Intrasporangium sp.]
MSTQHQERARVDLLVTGAAEVLTCAAGAADLIGSTSGGVAVDGGLIVAVGDISSYAAELVIDARGGIVLPGFVDAHTHVVFGGSRAQEYAARVAGRQPPAGAVVGITGTMTATRAAGRDALRKQAAARLREMVEHGTTTVESKSGYGLDTETEIATLDTNRVLQQQLPVDLASTFLGAHAFPPGADQAAYVDLVVRLAQRVGAEGLAEFCDVYCDEGYFDLAQTERILRAGLEAGLAPKVHLDAYSHTGAAALAAELGATSVDHLNLTTDAELTMLGEAGVAGVYMPCLDYAVRHPQPLDPRRVLDAGMELALATDICPGCWTTSMQLAIQMACRAGGLSVAQALRAATLGSAAALGRADRVGSLEVGKQADLIVLDVPSPEDIAYRLGRNNVTTVVRRGRVVHESNPAPRPEETR